MTEIFWNWMQFSLKSSKSKTSIKSFATFLLEDFFFQVFIDLLPKIRLAKLPRFGEERFSFDESQVIFSCQELFCSNTVLKKSEETSSQFRFFPMQIFNIPQNICEQILHIFIILNIYSCLGTAAILNFYRTAET